MLSTYVEAINAYKLRENGHSEEGNTTIKRGSFSSFFKKIYTHII